jgi:hypothetical protein
MSITKNPHGLNIREYWSQDYKFYCSYLLIACRNNGRATPYVKSWLIVPFHGFFSSILPDEVEGLEANAVNHTHTADDLLVHSEQVIV